MTLNRWSLCSLLLVPKGQNRFVHACAANGDAIHVERKAAGKIVNAGWNFNDLSRYRVN